MVEQIKAFKTSDGQVFQNEGEAMSHELLTDLRVCFDDDIAYGKANFDAAIEWIKANLITLVIALGNDRFIHKRQLGKVYRKYSQCMDENISRSEIISDLTKILSANINEYAETQSEAELKQET